MCDSLQNFGCYWSVTNWIFVENIQRSEHWSMLPLSFEIRHILWCNWGVSQFVTCVTQNIGYFGQIRYHLMILLIFLLMGNMAWCYFSLLSLLNYFQVKFWSFCPFLYKFALACSSKRDVCDMLKCPQNNNWPTADHSLRFLSRSLGLTWYQESKNGLNYLSVLLKNNKITSKRDVCDRKKQEVEVWYLVKIVFDRLCTPNFLII